MTTQTTLFPKTELDEATAVLSHLIAEEEKADKASDAADQKVADTAARARKQRHVVARLQAMMPAAEPIAEGEVVSNDVEDAEVLQIEGDVLDPITGEIVGREALAEGLEPVAEEMLEDLASEGDDHALAECPECQGDGRLPDKTGGGHHKCKACDGTGHAEPSCDNCTASCNLRQRAGSSTMRCGGSSWLHGEMMGKAAEPNVSVVVVLYPGSDEPVVTEIGDRTRYGELVADYFTAAGLNGKHDARDWQVKGEDDGFVRKLRDVIAGSDYGKRLIVEMTPEAAIARDNAKVGAA